FPCGRRSKARELALALNAGEKCKVLTKNASHYRNNCPRIAAAKSMPQLPFIAGRGLARGLTGRSDDRLAQADAAVVAGDTGVGQHGEAPPLKAGDRASEQQQVLEDAA